MHPVAGELPVQGPNPTAHGEAPRDQVPGPPRSPPRVREEAGALRCDRPGLRHFCQAPVPDGCTQDAARGSRCPPDRGLRGTALWWPPSSWGPEMLPLERGWQHVASSPGTPEARGQGSGTRPIARQRALSEQGSAELTLCGPARGGVWAAGALGGSAPSLGLCQGRDPVLPLGCGHWTHILFSDWDIFLPVPSAGPRKTRLT